MTKRLIDLLVRSVDIVDNPANQRPFIIIKQLMPSEDASIEEKREAQKRRAKRYGIEALEGKGERLTFPKGYPQELDAYSDRTNLLFPLEPPNRARNARARFKQHHDMYSETKSKRIVHERIIRKLLKIGAKPSYDPEDPLDQLLPPDLKEELTKSIQKQEDEEMATDNLNINKDQAVEAAVEKQLSGDSESKESTQEKPKEIEKQEVKKEEKEIEKSEETKSEDNSTKEVIETQEGEQAFNEELVNLINKTVSEAVAKVMPKQEAEEKPVEKSEESKETKSEEAEEKEVEKAGAAISKKRKETMKSAIDMLVKAVDSLNSMIETGTETAKEVKKSEETKETKSEEAEETTAIKEVAKSINSLTESFQKINERLNKVESTVNVSKSVGDGDSEGDSPNQSSFWGNIV